MNGSSKGFVLTGLAAAIVLAACGKNESPTAPPTPSTSPGTSATTPPPTGSASTSPAPGVAASGPAAAPSASASATPGASASAPAASPSGSASAPTATATAATPGEDTYNKTCMACHGTGVAGAPKLGDKADWMPRLTQGKQVLYEHAIKGYTGAKGVMPPKGGATNLSDEEVRAAVDFMVARGS